MKCSAGRWLSLLGCSLLLSGALSAGAWAQANPLMPDGPAGAGNIATGRRNGGQSEPAKPTVAPPDAVPGAKAREPVVPATRAAGDMAPDDALFDAINRGDIAAARDALSRGAELNATNVLGMTPMELSVDLGRNDISFLLLSMRGGDDSGGPPPSALHASTQGDASMLSSGAAPTPTKRGRGKAVPHPAPVAMKPVAQPRLFANDGGTPQPNAGFLGFDARSAAN